MRYSLGFSTLEVLVWLSVFTFTVGAVVSSILYFYRVNAVTLDQASSVASAQRGIDAMVRAIREAAYASDGAYPIVSLADDQFAFYADVDADPPTVGNGVTDVGCVHMDTDQAVATARLEGDGTTGAAVGSTLVTRDGSTGWTPTASGVIDVIVGIEANKTRCWIWDSLAPVGIMTEIAQGPDADILVRPYAYFRTRNTTSKTVSILKAVILCEENRGAT